MQDNKTSSLKKHLVGGDISAIETALKLESTVGFPYSDYQYFSYDWDSEEEYDKFISNTENSSSISGGIRDNSKDTTYYVNIVLYKGKYFVQVESDWDHDATDRTSYHTDSFPDYLSALKFAYDIVF